MPLIVAAWQPGRARPSPQATGAVTRRIAELTRSVPFVQLTGQLRCADSEHPRLEVEETGRSFRKGNRRCRAGTSPLPPRNVVARIAFAGNRDLRSSSNLDYRSEPIAQRNGLSMRRTRESSSPVSPLASAPEAIRSISSGEDHDPAITRLSRHDTHDRLDHRAHGGWARLHPRAGSHRAQRLRGGQSLRVLGPHDLGAGRDDYGLRGAVHAG